MSLLRYRGMLVLALWQAPLPVERDEAGRLRLTFGFGRGAFEEISLNCASNVVSADRVPFTSGGVHIDAWPAEQLRISAFAGRVGARALDGVDWSGSYGGQLVAFEGSKLGLGAGAAQSDYEGVVPSGYLRLGRLDRLHFRTDLHAPMAAFGTTGQSRIGLGFNQGRTRSVSGFAGLACQVCMASGRAVAFAELDIPLTRALDLDVRGLIGPGESMTQWGLGVGGRFHLWR